MQTQESEGLLKKRKVSALHISNALQAFAINSKHEYIPIEVLSEAKQDFPLECKENFPNDEALDRHIHERQMMKWLDKWFGTTQQK